MECLILLGVYNNIIEYNNFWEKQILFSEIRFTDTYFYIVFKPSKAYIEMLEPEKVGENESKILNLISKNKHITYIELAGRLNVTGKGVYMDIEKLKKKGLLKRIGPAKRGYWKIIKWN